MHHERLFILAIDLVILLAVFAERVAQVVVLHSQRMMHQRSGRFANNMLREARKVRGWTIEQAAEHVGVDVTTFNRWELGIQRPRKSSWQRLKSVFSDEAGGITYQDIFLANVEGAVAAIKEARNAARRKGVAD
jgi:DNA-binding XRE family transcriptional regulator